MRSKAPLALMEQSVMVLVFALAAVLCLRAFIWAETQSVNNGIRDQAVHQAQMTAETVKHWGREGLSLYEMAQNLEGEYGGEYLRVYYDDQWQTVSQKSKAAYSLTLKEVGSGLRGLGEAQIRVAPLRGEPYITLDICWQEAR